MLTLTSAHFPCPFLTEVSDPSRDGPYRSVLHCAPSLSSRVWSACFRRVQLDYGQKTRQSRAARFLFGAVVLQVQINSFRDNYATKQQLLQETRRAYRELLYCADIGSCISGAIMNKEMLTESDSQSRPFTVCLTQQAILPGVKVDEVGTEPSSEREATEDSEQDQRQCVIRGWKLFQPEQAKKRHTRKAQMT